MKRMQFHRGASGKAAQNSALTTADLVVLSLIRERPMHGYELVKEYERQEVEDWASVSRPHVYYALQKLAERGLIEPINGAEAADPRGKTVYRTTRSGVLALSGALASPTWAQSRAPTSFDTWLGLSIHARASDRRRVLAARRAYLDAQLEKERQTLKAIEADSGSRVPIAAVMVGLCIAQFETERNWLEKLEAALR
ncbi:MAG: PadR family transcriptional regulator [Burkholderiaceae bacterium]|nr:PadR family transcriptional regulator [Burkholderiaceae bacterium]